ncbi:MAG: hypothetical protein COA78_32525 [Blastopirellula sp.]|nr:MAG: hypothetical protein COA78_32525 [Blastopirellula sp.]
MKNIVIPDTFYPRGPNADNLALLANDLMFKTCQKEEYWNRGFYIPYGCMNWRQSLPCKTYGPVKEDAIKQGLIDSIEKYSNFEGNIFPKSLRLAAQHRQAPGKTYTLKRNLRAKKRFSFDEDDVIGLWLASKLPLFSLDPGFNYIKLKASLSSDAEARYQQTKNEEDRWTDSKSNYLHMSYGKLLRHNLFANRCEYGRFHSLFTQINRELRDFIQFNGKSLIEVDISNCQPLILGILGKGDTYSTKRYENMNLNLTEYSKYLSICSEGLLYEYLLDCSDGLFIDRDDVKAEFLPFLFAKNKRSMKSPFYSIFNSEFPSLARYCVQMKKEDHRALSWACQRFESKLMIDEACGILRESNPEMPIITIHDSIMTTPEHQPEVEAAIYQAFSKYGVKPMLKIKGATTPCTTDSQDLAI